MKTKTVNIPDELFARMVECMARTRIFNASEFIRLSVDAAVERVEKKHGLGAYAPENERGRPPVEPPTQDLPEIV